MKRWQIIAISAAVLVGLYYLTIPVFGPHFADVCSKGEYGPPDQCTRWDIVTASILRLFVWLDGHNGLVAALASVIIAAFTGVLWRATDKTADLAEKTRDLAQQQVAIEGLQTDVLTVQKEIAREQFFAQHRPILVLRDVYFSRGDSFDEISFEIANTGGTKALVKAGFVAAEFVTDPRQFKHTEGRDPEPLKDNGFGAGQFRPFALRTSEDMQRKLRFLHLPEEVRRAETNYGEYASAENRPPHASDYYFFGVIFYTDGRGNEFEPSYVSVFRRRWNPETLSFERTGNPDHEYSD